MVPFSPTSPPHAIAGDTATATKASASAATPTIRRMIPSHRCGSYGRVRRSPAPAGSRPAEKSGAASYVARMPELHAHVGSSVLAALHDQARSSGAPVDHLVECALAEFLGVEHHTLYQVSTAGALVEGVYQGAVSVGVVREHGDFGLGTFEDLDGEMIVLDGHVFRVGASGEVHEVHDDATTPFAVVTRFGDPDTVVLDEVDDLAALTAAVDELRDS